METIIEGTLEHTLAVVANRLHTTSNEDIMRMSKGELLALTGSQTHRNKRYAKLVQIVLDMKKNAKAVEFVLVGKDDPNYGPMLDEYMESQDASDIDYGDYDNDQASE